MRIIATCTAVLLAAAVAAGQQPPPPAPGITLRPVFDNPTVTVARITLAPGAREMPHTHPYSLVTMLLTPGDLDMLKGETTTRRAREVPNVDFVPRGLRHAAANVGASPIDGLVVAIKPDRVPGGTSPPLPRPAGITATDVLDATDAAVRRVELAAGAREVTHTHPYDFVVVAVTRSRMEVQLAGKTETKEFAVGDAFFIPRDTPHAVANPGTAPLALLGVAIK
jgi:quercetin dioxygenase-like cupin family protein